jgi:hypothetical protein
VQIGCNDLQGADLSRRLLHGSVPNQALSVRLRWVQRLDNLQAPSVLIAKEKWATRPESERFLSGSSVWKFVADCLAIAGDARMSRVVFHAA